MASTLATLSARVSQTLLDTGNTIWPAGAITEGIRSALGEYNAAGLVQDAAAVAVTLDGLDSAAATTLPAVHDIVIVWGAAGYCAAARAVDRADTYQLGAKAETLKGWSDARLREFRAMLGAIYPKYIGVAGSSGGESDPAKVAAEIALLTAQAGLATSQASHTDGQESREAAAAAQASQDRADEAARLADLRASTNAPWGSWADQDANKFEGEKPE